MAMHIKNSEVERLAAEVARIAGESKTEAIRRALEERKSRLAARLDRFAQLMHYLEYEVWPTIPPEIRGKKMSKREREEILGIAPRGYSEP
jgi:antitoxin VapB